MPRSTDATPSPSTVPSGAAGDGLPRVLAQLSALLRTMRPKQWTKNAFVLVGLIFDGKLLDLPLVASAALTLVCFCLVSSSVYILNDLVDVERDRLHPRKRLRPLPNGELSVRLAWVSLPALAAVSIIGGVLVDPAIGLTLAAYFALNAAYCFSLKNVVILDVMMIAVFFILRVVAGAVAVDVSAFSPWLYICVSLLALFIGFGKRRHELVLLKQGASDHRTSLGQYNLTFLDQIIGIVTTCGLISYTLYSFEAETALAGPEKMLATVPFIVYVGFRYLYLILVEQKGGAPEDLLFRDRPLFAGGSLWLLSVVAVIYFW